MLLVILRNFDTSLEANVLFPTLPVLVPALSLDCTQHRAESERFVKWPLNADALSLSFHSFRVHHEFVQVAVRCALYITTLMSRKLP